MNRNLKSPILIVIMLLALSLVLRACATPPPTAAPVPTQDVGMIQTQAAHTVVAEAALNAPPTATATIAPTGPTPNPSIPVAVVPTADPSGPSAIDTPRLSRLRLPDTIWA